MAPCWELHHMNHCTLFLQQYSSLVETALEGKRSVIWKTAACLKPIYSSVTRMRFNFDFFQTIQPYQGAMHYVTLLLQNRRTVGDCRREPSLRRNSWGGTHKEEPHKGYSTRCFWRPNRCTTVAGESHGGQECLPGECPGIAEVSRWRRRPTLSGWLWRRTCPPTLQWPTQRFAPRQRAETHTYMDTWVCLVFYSLHFFWVLNT